MEDFKGRDGAECEAFIKSVRRAAWESGKTRDSAWMADFAAFQLSGRALKWHSDLSLDVRQDWFKLEKALLERWPLPEDNNDGSDGPGSRNIPTPAAASIQTIETKQPSGLGVMKFVPAQGNNGRALYASTVPSNGGTCSHTANINKALKLRWDRSENSEARVLEWVKDSGYEWLAIHWANKTPKFESGSEQWGRLTVACPRTLTTAHSRYNPDAVGSFKVTTWKLDSEQSIVPVWEDGDRVFQLGVFASDSYIYFAADPDTYQKENPNETRGHLFFQHLSFQEIK